MRCWMSSAGNGAEANEEAELAGMADQIHSSTVTPAEIAAELIFTS